jgi:hypothetical protein
MSGHTLNHDVLDAIFSYLLLPQRDSWPSTSTVSKSSLCAAALTCRMWQKPAKRYIYQDIDFHGDSGAVGLTVLPPLLEILRHSGAYVRHMRWLKPPNVGTFSDSLEHYLRPPTSPRLPHNAEECVVLAELTGVHQIAHTFYIAVASHSLMNLQFMLKWAPNLGNHIAGVLWDNTRSGLDGSAGCTELMPHLSALATFQLHRSWILSESLASCIAESLTTDSIISLKIHSCMFDSPRTLFSLVSTFPQPTSLSLARIGCRVIMCDGSRLQARSPPLQRLYLHVSPHDTFLKFLARWIQTQGQNVRLEVFNLSGIAVYDLSVLDPLLQYCSTSLKIAQFKSEFVLPRLIINRAH